MKMNFRLEGLDCPHCAEKIEVSVDKLDGIISASMNFMTQKLAVEAVDGYATLARDVMLVVKAFDPKVKVTRI